MLDASYDDPDGTPVYGANNNVEVLGGSVRTQGCLITGGKDDTGAVYIANTDIILKREPDGSPGAFTPITTSISALGGLDLGTVLGMTKPTGPIPSGTYTVVYDECQDKRLAPDPGFDAEFRNAFRVEVPANAPTLTSLAEQKKKAQDAADAAAQVQKVIKIYGKFQKASGVIAKVAPEAGWTRAAASLPSVSGAFGTSVSAFGKDAQRIANDPPDQAFAQVTELAVPTGALGAGSDPLVGAEADAAADLALAGALEKALVTALERYQGAAAARNGHWALVHAREVDQFSVLLAAQLTRTKTSLTALGQGIVNAGPLDAATLDVLRSARTGLSADQVRQLRDVGLTTTELAALITDLQGAGLDTLSPATVSAAFGGLGDALGSWAAGLGGLATDARSAAGALLLDPGTAGVPPVASAGSGYSSPVGGTITLDASATSGGAGETTFAWDLNGDGRFDDGAGVALAAPAGAVGHRLVAVHATDRLGQESFGYATVNVTAGAPAVPATTPDASVQSINVGATRTFAVATSQPVSWVLDGRPVGSSSSYDYTPTLSQTGLRYLDAVLDDPTGRKLVTEWPVVVAANDADGDGWTANVDCDDRVAAVNPGQQEVVGDGLDNDCNPATPDGEGSAYTRPTVPEKSLTTTAGQAVTQGRGKVVHEVSKSVIGRSVRAA
jgi:hypothetical protein